MRAWFPAFMAVFGRASATTLTAIILAVVVPVLVVAFTRQRNEHAKTETNTITYRERVVSGMSPRVLAQEIVERNSSDRIGEIILSGDAFAKQTSDLTIAIQMEEIFRQNGLPSPVQAEMIHGARISGWQLMYSLLESKEWLIADACPALIECIPTPTRDEDDPEDVFKMDGGRLAEAFATIPPAADGHPNYTRMYMMDLEMREAERKRWQPIPLTRTARFRRSMNAAKRRRY